MKNYERGTPAIDEKFQIRITQAGPYVVFGNPPIRSQTIIADADGRSWAYLAGDKNYAKIGIESVALCRCGHSQNAPYCDAHHLKTKWNPSLTASRRSLCADAERIVGPTLTLTDNPKYCAYARFCDARGNSWNLTRSSGDVQNRIWAIQTVQNCPSGRLKAWDNESSKALEPTLAPQVGLIEDPVLGVSGPLWVMGGIPVVAADDYVFQVRNRVSLCRCGASANKPFCDGTHAKVKFTDGIK
ncbi:MAG: CDGSH iron-sulfur domain-containing protein [Mucinivorans sp.]